ncbi:MAG: Calx-beta domain-containing protein [Chloroflexota bacterium]
MMQYLGERKARDPNRRRFGQLTLVMAALLALTIHVGGGWLYGVPVAHAATFTVTKTADTADGTCDADCSLREAITAAASGDTIIFDPSLAGQTITLNIAGASDEDANANGDLDITKNLIIMGPTGGITINGNGAERVFHISGAFTVNLSNMNITNGNATGQANTNGGGILVIAGATLNIENAAVYNNTATAQGGGIQVNGSTLNGTNITVSGNTATNAGINAQGGSTVTLNNVTVASNTGRGIRDSGSNMNLTNSIVAGHADDCAGAINGSTNSVTDGTDAGCTGFTTSVNVSLAGLADNGGSSQTHALNADSEAIDRVLTASCPDTDQRGVSRSIDVPGITNGADFCDIGAYEFLPEDLTMDISINSPAAVNEGDTNQAAPLGTVIDFTVSLSQTAVTTITVDYATADGTATAPGDYAATNGTLTFPPGSINQTIQVDIAEDTTAEAVPNPESFTVNLTNAQFGTITTGTGTGQITDDDAAGVTLVIDKDTTTPSIIAGKQVTYTIAVTNTGGGTANNVIISDTLPTGFSYSSQSVTLNGGATGPTGSPTAGATVLQWNGITLPTNAGIILTFVVDVSSATAAGTYQNTAQASADGVNTIDDDGAAAGDADTVDDTGTDEDVAVTAAIDVSVDSVEVTEGDAGTTNMTFEVSLAAPAAVVSTVDYATTDGTATVADSDYASMSGTLIFNVGEQTKTVTVVVNSDTTPEDAENLTLTLSNACNLNITTAMGIGTIHNDDANVSIADGTLTEGNSGTTVMAFVVSLDKPITGTINVDYATADSGSATAGTDYTATSGTLTFNTGETSQTINVPIIGDTSNEGNETFVVNLTNLTVSAVVFADNQATGTITDDDTPAGNNNSGGNDDDDDGGSTATGAPAPSTAASTASVPANAPLPVATLPETGYTPVSPISPWVIIGTLALLELGALSAWGISRYRNRQQVAKPEVIEITPQLPETVQPQQPIEQPPIEIVSEETKQE